MARITPPPPLLSDSRNRSKTARRRRLAGALVALLTAAYGLGLPSLPASAQTTTTESSDYLVSLSGTNAGTLVREGGSVTIRASLSIYTITKQNGRIASVSYVPRAINNTGGPIVVPLRLDTSIAGSAQAADVTLPSITIQNGWHSATTTVSVVDDSETEEYERARIIVGSGLADNLRPNIRKPSSIFYIRHSDGADLGRLLFRVCGEDDGVCPLDGDTGWVETDSPSITLHEGGDPVSYQYRLSEVGTQFNSIEVRPLVRKKTIRTTTGRGTVGTAQIIDLNPPGRVDSNRVTCEASADHGRARYPSSWPAEYVATLSHCPHVIMGVGWDQRDRWRTVTFSAGDDSDTLDHTGAIIHFTLARQAWWLGNLGGNYYQHPDQFPVSLTVIDDDRPAEDRVGLTVSQEDQGGRMKLSVEDAERPDGTADPAVIARVEALAAQTQHGGAHVNRWRRALAGLGALDPAAVTGGAMTAAEAQEMADRHSSPVWEQVVAELTALEAAPVVVPEVGIVSGGDVTEGGDAVFTVTASPAPADDLVVSVSVTAAGDYGVSAGARNVTIPTSGSATLTVATTGDDTDEADGSVTATLDAPGADAGYTVSATAGAATAAVTDDDNPTPVVSVSGGGGVTEGGGAVFTVSASPAPAADLDVRVAVSTVGDFGAATGTQTVTIPTSGSATLTVATTGDAADEPDGSVTATLVDGSAYDLGSSATATVTVADDDPPPVVSIAAGNGVGEGADAQFTVTASPAPATPLPVTVAFAQNGDFAVSTGIRTVTVPASGSVTISVETIDDSTDEPDGSVTATLRAGSAYTIGVPASVSVSVADDDPPPPPVVSISGGQGVSEGRSAVFTVSVAPPQATPLQVTVAVAQNGDFGVSVGTRTVTVLTTGSATLTVATSDDSDDEPHGSVTATVSTGSGYTISTAHGAASVPVADDDDPPQTTQEPSTLPDCSGLPTVSVSDTTASRSDGSARFVIALDCKPRSAATVYYVVARDDNIGANTILRLSASSPTSTVEVSIGSTQKIEVHVVYALGTANRNTKGTLTITN